MILMTEPTGLLSVGLERPWEGLRQGVPREGITPQACGSSKAVLPCFLRLLFQCLSFDRFLLCRGPLLRLRLITERAGSFSLNAR